MTNPSPRSSDDGHGGAAVDIPAISRIVLRPIGSPLPMGVLALVPAGVVMGVMQLGGIPVTACASSSDRRAGADAVDCRAWNIATSDAPACASPPSRSAP